MILISLVLGLGCAKPEVAEIEPVKLPNVAVSDLGKRTVVLYNKKVPGSKELAEFYASKRGIPPSHIAITNVAETEEMALGELTEGLYVHLRTKIKELVDQGEKIDFIVFSKGIPLRTWQDRHYSVDGYVSTMDMQLPHVKNDPPTGEELQKIANPYFGKSEPFSHAKYGFYLVTRLDGYTFEDARRLVENAARALPNKGPFFLDSDPGRRSGGYEHLEKSLANSEKNLKSKGYEVVLESTDLFVKPGQPVAGYASWGSNDGHFDLGAYRGIQFKPGAIAETFVSTSGRTFIPGTEGGQSLIADLVRSGVTGVKGYVKEPYAFALAKPDILFDRYTSGFTLAESFYMASPLLKWKDIIVGDAICAPYKK
ncbi:MAG: TIGR03790 family protein [Fimbriimonadaceae bacterium]